MTEEEKPAIPVAVEDAGLCETATSRAMNNVNVLSMIIDKLECPSYTCPGSLSEVSKTWDKDVLPRRINKLWKTLWDKRFASAFGAPHCHRYQVLDLGKHASFLPILSSMGDLSYTKIVCYSTNEANGRELQFANVIVSCSATLTELALNGPALLRLANIAGSNRAIAFPKVEIVSLDLIDFYSGGDKKTSAEDVEMAILFLPTFTAMTQLYLQLGGQTSGTRSRAQLPWQQREVALSIAPKPIKTLSLYIEVLDQSEMDSGDIAELLADFNCITAFEFCVSVTNVNLPDHMWPRSIQKLSLDCDGHNVPQFLHALSQAHVLPDLRFVPRVTVTHDPSNKSLDDVVTRWMVDQAVAGLKRRKQSIANIELEKLSLYGMVNEGVGDMPLVDPGWATMRRGD